MAFLTSPMATAFLCSLFLVGRSSRVFQFTQYTPRHSVNRVSELYPVRIPLWSLHASVLSVCIWGVLYPFCKLMSAIISEVPFAQGSVHKVFLLVLNSFVAITSETGRGTANKGTQWQKNPTPEGRVEGKDSRQLQKCETHPKFNRRQH